MKTTIPFITTMAVTAAILSCLPSFALGGADAQSVAALPETAVQTSKKFPSLSTEQLEKLHALKLQFDANNAGKMAQLKVLKEQLKDTLSKPVVDKGAALSLQSKINAIKDDLANARVIRMADASTIFTPEQREAFRRRMLMRDAFGGGRHKMGRHGKGFGGHGSGGHKPAHA